MHLCYFFSGFHPYSKLKSAIVCLDGLQNMQYIFIRHDLFKIAAVMGKKCHESKKEMV